MQSGSLVLLGIDSERVHHHHRVWYLVREAVALFGQTTTKGVLTRRRRRD